MLANMAVSLIEHKRITTTSTKAKALKIFIEPLITKSKDDNTHNRIDVVEINIAIKSWLEKQIA